MKLRTVALLAFAGGTLFALYLARISRAAAKKRAESAPAGGILGDLSQ